MLSITRIFSHNRIKNISTLQIQPGKTSHAVGESFVSRQKTKTMLQRFSEWWNNLLYASRCLKCHEHSYLELYSAEKYKIAQRRGLFRVNFFHPERIFDSSEIDTLVTLSETEFRNFRKRNLSSLAFPKREGWRAYDLTFIAKLSDKSYANIQKRGLALENSPLRKYIHSAYDLAQLAKLSDKEFANIEARKLLNPRLYKNFFRELEGDDIAMLARLSDDVFRNIQKRNLTSPKYYNFSRNFSIYDIAELAKLSDEAFANIEKRGLMCKDFCEKYNINFGEDICTLAKLSDNKYEFAKKFLEKQYFMNRKPVETGRMLKECSIETIEKLQKMYSNSEIISLFSSEKGMTFLRKLGIVDLIANKKLNIDVVKSLAKTINDERKKLSDEIISDINLLKNGKSVVKEFTKGTSLNNAFISSSVGDAVQIGEKMFINDGEKLLPWQMDRKTFDKLFPAVKRFMIKQRAADCYLISAIDASMRNPFARAKLYDSFKTDGNDIICTIRAYKDFKGSVKFENGKSMCGFQLAEACPAVRMLEYAYAKTAIRHEGPVLPYLNSNNNMSSLIKRIDAGEVRNAFHELLGLQYMDGYALPKLNKKTGKMEIKYTPFSPVEVSLPKRYSLKSIHVHDWHNVLKQYANKDEYLLNFSTFINAKNDKYDIIGCHAYAIVGYDPIKKIVSFVNPINTAGVIEIPVSQLGDYSFKITIAKIK